MGFQALLRGETAEDRTGDGYQSRATESWLRRLFDESRLQRRWIRSSTVEREGYAQRSFFNGGSHVQACTGMPIVPGFLAWLRLQVRAQAATAAEVLSAFEECRRGASVITPNLGLRLGRLSLHRRRKPSR